MRRLRTILIAALFLLPGALRADEGLWLVQDLNSSIEKRMRERGLKMRARAIYDMDSPGAGVADAVVSLGGRYSGVFVSDKGLFLTSGRPAVSFIGKLGDAGKDLILDGFWSATEQHEIKVPGEKVYALKRVYDVTREYKDLILQLKDKSQAVQKLEKAYSEATKLTCFFHAYWEGEEAYICAYKVYDDVRLVAAPPAAAVLPEGEGGKWAWPSSRCDFSLYRVYEKGLPARISNSLIVSVDGYSKDSFTYVAGFPSSTGRTLSSEEYLFRENVARPMASRMGGARLAILEHWMSEEASVRSKYSVRANRLKEVLDRESASREMERSGKLLEKKTSFDELIQSRVDKDAKLGGRWSGVMGDLKESFGRIVPGEMDKTLREQTLVNGTFVGEYLVRAASASNLEEASEILFTAIRQTDPRVEKDLLSYAMAEYFTNLDMRYFGPYQRWIQDRFGYDWDAAAEYLWSRSLLSKPSITAALESVDDIKDDSLYKFLTDSPLRIYDLMEGHSSKLNEASLARSEYLKARYWAGVRNNDPDYPDADGTLRLAYGTADGNFTTAPMLLEAMGSSASNRWKSALEKDFWGRWGFRVNGKRHGMATCFSTNIDFAEGMEGSPVLDPQGRLLGIVSGGTPAGIAGREMYVEGRTGTVCVDIRFILWTIDRYAGYKRLLKEFVID